MATSNFQHIATAALGALVLSTACVTAAVGPARVIEASPVQTYAAAEVQIQDRADA